MAQVNRNANYLFTIDGNTVWERLRVVRGFLEDRRLALKVAELNKQKSEEIQNTALSLDEKYKLLESELFKEQLESNLEDCRNEVKFLEELESKLLVEAEKLRIPGKTDKEMYELNYFEELAQIHMIDIQAQLITNGTITTEMMKTLIRNPHSMHRAVQEKLVSKELQEKIIFFSSPVSVIGNNTLKQIGVKND